MGVGWTCTWACIVVGTTIGVGTGVGMGEYGLEDTVSGVYGAA